MAEYRVELRFKHNVVGHNIFPMTRNLRYTKRRNGATSIDFGINTQQFHEWCDKRGELPQNVLWEHLTDIIVYRDEKHVASGYVVKLPGNMNKANSTIQVQVDGYVKQLEGRRVTKVYSNMYTGDIFRDALEMCQSEENGDMGFSVASDSYRGLQGTRQDTYERTTLHDILVNRASYVSDPYDFDIDENRVVRMYEHKGNKRYDTVITYPVELGTIGATSASFSHTGTEVANRVIGLGYGEGEEVLQYVANDYASQLKYGIIEDVVTFNDVKLESTLIDYTEAELEKRKEIIVLPKLNVNGAHFDVGSHDVGDCIVSRHTKYGLYKMEDLYRIEEMSVNVSKNGWEDVSLTVDDFSVW